MLTVHAFNARQAALALLDGEHRPLVLQMAQRLRVARAEPLSPMELVCLRVAKAEAAWPMGLF